MKEGERPEVFMSQKVGTFWSPGPEQHIDEDRRSTSVIIQFGAVVLLSTNFGDGVKSSEEKNCK